MGLSPIVGILGHRQVGKTTFIEHNSSSYTSFDDSEVLESASQHPKEFVANMRGLRSAIDESQLCPQIFSALKERVRVDKRPGQFVLSGSVRFTSKKSIRESLTGRIQYAELLPLSISELDAQPLGSKLSQLGGVKLLKNLLPGLSMTAPEYHRRQKLVNTYLVNGGLPGICFIRKDNLREAKILDQLRTILDRDLRQIYSTQLSFDVVFEFLSEISKYEGQAYRYEHYRSLLGLSPITQKKLLYALEAIFLVRRVSIEGDARGFSYFLEDQAESRFLSSQKQSREVQLLGLLYRNLRCEFFYKAGAHIKVSQYQRRSSSRMPLVFSGNDFHIGIIYSGEADVSRSTLGSVGSFLRTYPNAKAVVVHDGPEVDVIDSRTLLCSVAALI
jgi:predicted AAA+ superfamily ATPase